MPVILILMHPLTMAHVTSQVASVVQMQRPVILMQVQHLIIIAVNTRSRDMIVVEFV